MSPANPATLLRLALFTALVLATAACSGDRSATDEGDPAGVDATPGAAADQTGPAAPAAGPAEPEDVAAPDEHMPAVGLDENGRPHMWASAAQVGGGMLAVAEACDHPSVADIDAARAEQRRSSAALGADPEDFMEVADWAYADAGRKLGGASATQIAESCAELQELEARANPEQN